MLSSVILKITQRLIMTDGIQSSITNVAIAHLGITFMLDFQII